MGRSGITQIASWSSSNAVANWCTAARGRRIAGRVDRFLSLGKQRIREAHRRRGDLQLTAIEHRDDRVPTGCPTHEASPRCGLSKGTMASGFALTAERNAPFGLAHAAAVTTWIGP